MRPVFDISDNEATVRALQKGDERAFEAVYQAYAGRLRRYAATVMKDEEWAFEVVQDTFVAVWLNRKDLDESKPLRHYLLRAVHNNALRWLRAEERRRKREQTVMEEAPEGGAEGAGEEEDAASREKLALAIGRLPEQSRRVLEMSYWEKKKNAEIARELSISVRTVETILYKVRKKLRGEIKKDPK